MTSLCKVKRIQRKVSSILATTFIFLWVSVPVSAFAATIYADSSTGNDSTGDGSAGAPYKTFHKAYTSATSGDTIDLTGTFDWSSADETGDASTSGYSISKNLTVAGRGDGTTIIQASSTSGTAGRRVFTLNSANSLTLRDLTVRYGQLSGSNDGGCINAQGGTLSLLRVHLYGCRTTDTTYGDGGGIYGYGIISATSSSFYNNYGGYYGGAIKAGGSSNGRLYVTDSSFFNNSNGSGSGGGSAIWFDYGTAYITNSTITNNSGSYGAGLTVYWSGTVYMRNSILANNSGNSSGKNLYLGFSGALNSAYNIIGAYNTGVFNSPGTGDWTDQNGDGTYVLTSVGTTGSLSLTATTTAANGTMYSALQTGSIGIGHGTSTANGPIAVSSTDQIGRSRGASVDIGAVQYSADNTAPSVSLTAPDDGSTVAGAAITLAVDASDDIALAGVKFYVNDALIGVEDTSSPYSIAWDSTATSSGSKTIFAVARDAANNYATSSSRTVTLANQPTPSSVSATTTATSTTVSWTTPAEGSTRLYFGFTNALASSTPEQNTSSRVTSHSVDVSGLLPCAVFRYKTVSKNAANEIATSSESTFQTAGCSGDASIVSNDEADIEASLGGTLTHEAVTLTVPSSFTATTSTATFQAKKLDGSTFFDNVDGPSDKTRVGSIAYNLSAYVDALTALSVFSSPITVALSYEDDDISSLDESTLAIWRYDGSEWSQLSGCGVDTNANVVSCTTSAFSDFAIFGDEASAQVVSTPSSSSRALGTSPTRRYKNLLSIGKIQEAEELKRTFSQAPDDVVAVDEEVADVTATDLYLGSEGEAVKGLQEFLIAQNVGPIARELARVGATGYFGPYTKNALGEYQKSVGIMPHAGYFGPMTRIYLESVGANR